ncbi:MAG TPA: hypothetical protein VHI13_08570 [Candidatus Kapabacteria bacterium]|nr:hypothetical protein [Candidatus Kapabacteria bacterium]
MANNYELSLQIDPTELAVISAAGMNITLAKPVGGAAPNVIWQSFDPFENNTVSWTEQYGIYAATSTVEHGATISKLSTFSPAEGGSTYTFLPNAIFSQGVATSDVPLTSYRIDNAMPASKYRALTFGLTQPAIINGVPGGFNALNADMVLSQAYDTLTPFTVVYVWLQANFASETMISQINTSYTKVTFGGTVTSVSLKFNSASGTFVQS